MKPLAILALLLFQSLPAVQSDTGVVTGRLLNTDSKPAAGVRIAAMALPENGTPNNFGSLLAIAETDKDGQYRLEKIPPGRYYITAGLVDAPSYYPGVSSPSAATVIQILGGKVIDKIDFTMAVPNGFRVSGHLAVKPSSPNPAPIMLSSLGGAKESPLSADDTFEFLKVTPGTYTLQAGFGLPAVSVVVTDHDVTGLEIGNGPGVRVSGRIVSPGTAPGMISTQNILLTGSGSPSLNTRPGSDGTFEFLKVPPGSYTLRILASGPIITTPVIVGDKDITGLELNAPYQTEVSGRVVMADGSRFQSGSPTISIEARYSNGSMGSAILPDGTFRLRMNEGEYQLGVRNLPLSMTLQSIKSGSTDLLQGGLRIAPGQTVNELVMTLATVSTESIKGVRLSGRVTGLPAGNAAIAKVVLSGADPGTPTIETTLNPDGSFEFPKVPPGGYTARVTGVPNADPTSSRFLGIYVGADNISGYQIPLNLRTMVSGKIMVVDQTGKSNSTVMPSGSVNFRRYNGTSGTSIRPDGTFSIPLDDGDQTISIERLPPQYTIQSITSGSVDLMKSPLKVDKNSPPAEIQVRIEFKP